MRKISTILAYLLIILNTFAVKVEQNLPYKNSKLSTDLRVKDLLSRMTLHEKILQLQHIQDAVKLDTLKGFSYGSIMNTNSSAAEVYKQNIEIQKFLKSKTRLGIPAFTISEGLHGLYQGGCTIYPQAIALGCTFNPDLVSKMAEMISLDANTLGIKQVLAPDLDIARELRWGRVEETFGEDPYLIANMATTYVKTTQKNNIICTPKHFVAHGTPTAGLNLASVNGGERDLRSLYLYPFEKLIKDANPISLMNAYSSYDGIPMAGSHYYLTELLRNELGFTGYVISDWDAVKQLYDFHFTASDRADAAQQAIQAGIDLEASSTCFLYLEKSVLDNKIDIKYIDLAVSRVLKAKFECGLFDQSINEKVDLKSVIHSAKSIALAREIADESIVLLKNEKSILPLSTDKYKSIALIGPNADQFQPGDYSWGRKKENGISLLKGLQDQIGGKVNINYAQGCDGWSQNKTGFAEAMAAAQKSDIVILVVGTSSGTFTDNKNATCGEGFDLTDLKLPGVQEDLLKEMKSSGKPVVVVLVSGKPLAIPWVKENADAALLQFYGGEEQGNALVDVLFGKVNPSGRLNVSFPQSVGHLPCFYNYKPSDKGLYKQPGSYEKTGRDYVFSNSDALWSFGYGLSYTTFNYEDAMLSKEIVRTNDTIYVDVKVKNTGDIEGKEVVQLYVHDIVSSVVVPVKQLKGFDKVLLKAGETKTVRFTLPISELSLINQNMKKVVEPGDFELQIGAASNDIKITKKITVVN